MERSALVNEEIVYFIFQLELDAQLQRALNYEAYEAAQQIRIKRETVSEVLCSQQEIVREQESIRVLCSHQGTRQRAGQRVREQLGMGRFGSGRCTAALVLPALVGFGVSVAFGFREGVGGGCTRPPRRPCRRPVVCNVLLLSCAVLCCAVL